MSTRARIAIIGAGLTGIIAARQLSERADVTIFEKSRGLGGRMSTRRAEPYFFDHGAQYFRARTAAFQGFLAPLIEAGIVARWSPRHVRISEAGEVLPATLEEPLYVAVPAMNALCKHLGEAVAVERSSRVAALVRDGASWRLTLESGEHVPGFDWVLSTAPAEQSQVLMPESFSARDALDAARMSGCFTLMLGFADRLDLPWDTAQFDHAPLGWVARNGSKPGRGGRPSLVVQSTNGWAEAHMEDPLDKVEAALTGAFSHLVPGLPAPEYTRLHRWRFAAIETPVGAPFLLDEAAGLSVAGDWCLRGRVEAAFESGAAVAEAIASRL